MSPEWKAWHAERDRLYKRWQIAVRGWNNDAGPIERTVDAGEALYFAADELINHLECEPIRAGEAA